MTVDSETRDCMANSTGSMRAGDLPLFRRAVINGEPMTMRTRERMNAASLAILSRPAAPVSKVPTNRASLTADAPRRRTWASSINAKSPWTNGSSFNGVVTDEYRTGTPSRRSLSPNARTVALSCAITAISFHARP